MSIDFVMVMVPVTFGIYVLVSSAVNVFYVRENQRLRKCLRESQSQTREALAIAQQANGQPDELLSLLKKKPPEPEPQNAWVGAKDRT